MEIIGLMTIANFSLEVAGSAIAGRDLAFILNTVTVFHKEIYF
jgi:hypothetical protein